MKLPAPLLHNTRIACLPACSSCLPACLCFFSMPVAILPALPPLAWVEAPVHTRSHAPHCRPRAEQVTTHFLRAIFEHLHLAVRQQAADRAAAERQQEQASR